MINSIDQLMEWILLGEDSTVEFKSQLKHRDRSNLADEIAAFANNEGGNILVGVSDNRDVIGLSIEDLDRCEKLAIEICHDSIEPEVRVNTQRARIYNKNILNIQIPRSLFVHRSPHGYFTRQGSSKRLIPQDYLTRLFQNRSQSGLIPFDKQGVPNTHKSNLDRSLYMQFIRQPDDGQQVEDELFKRHLLVKDNGNTRASVAGILMCSNRPDDFLQNSLVCAVCYRGTYKDSNDQIDAKDFDGPLNTQIIDAFKFVMKHNSVRAKKEIGRVEKHQYSMRAVFEALVNAAVHRDYSKINSKTRLFMYSDRLEIYSPGELANTLTIEDLPFQQSTRNELLARLLSEVSVNDEMGTDVERRYFLERRGEGVGIILRESEKLSGRRPSYEMYSEELCLTIYAANDGFSFDN